MTVKLRKLPNDIADEKPTVEAPQPTQIPPLVVSGVLVTRAALVQALRVYLPTLIDLQSIEADDRFILVVQPPSFDEVTTP